MQSPEDYIDFLILNGAIEVSGVDPAGEMTFQFTPKLAEVAPHIYQAMLQDLREDVMFFWMEGFVELTNSFDNPVVNLTAKAFDEEAISKLTPENIVRLKEFRTMFFR